MHKGEFAEVDLTFTTAGLEAKEHQIELAVTGNTARTLPRTRTLTTLLTITAPAVGSMSTISVDGLPTLGDKYDSGIFITARDADGLEIQTDNGENFEARLIPPDGGAPVQCSVVWSLDELTYKAECSLPKTNQAGEWLVEVSLDDEVFEERSVHMQCPAGEFEDDDTKCKICPDGADCSEPGRPTAI